MANALTKIRSRIKAIRKRHPKKSFKSAQAQAGREYRQGKLKTRRPRKSVHKKRTVKRRRKVAGIGPGNGFTPRENVARTRARVGSHKRKPSRRRRAAPKRVRARRRVGQSGGGDAMKVLLPVVLIGGLGLLAYGIFKNSNSAPPPPQSSSGLVQTGNNYRDSQAQTILAWATAAGMAAAAVAKLIQALNSSDDATVTQVKDSIDSGEGIPYGFIAGVTHPTPRLTY